VAAHLDLASSHLLAKRADDAAAELRSARGAYGPNLTFGWRLEMRRQLLQARLHLLLREPAEARSLAEAVHRLATAADVPRYGDEAALVRVRASAAMGERFGEVDGAESILERLPLTIGIDAWWTVAEAARDLDDDVLRREADKLAAALARLAGDEGGGVSTALASLLQR
jgi:hypothetical protein